MKRFRYGIFVFSLNECGVIQIVCLSVLEVLHRFAIAKKCYVSRIILVYLV